MHFHLIKITSTISLIISVSLLLLSPPPSFFLCFHPCHPPLGMVRNVVAWNLDLIVSRIDAMFFFPWSVFSLPHPHNLLSQMSSGERSAAPMCCLWGNWTTGVTSSAERATTRRTGLRDDAAGLRCLCSAAFYCRRLLKIRNHRENKWKEAGDELISAAARDDVLITSTHSLTLLPNT